MSIDEKIKQCYEHIVDEESREIYSDRVMYNITGDSRYMKNIIFRRSKFRDMRDYLKSQAGKKIILFGAGGWSDGVFSALRRYYDTEAYCYADNKAALKKSKRNGLKILSFDELCSEKKEMCVLITSLFWEDQIYSQLTEAGFDPENIMKVPSVVNHYLDSQYFDLPYFRHDKTEVFVDAGACDGGTAKQFVKWSRGDYEKVYSFEPNMLMKELLEASFSTIKGEFVLKGTWDRETRLKFIEGGQGSKCIEIDDPQETNDTVDVCSIDSFLNGKPASFIKMDVEGAEFKTIEGASQTIVRYRPKMAISLYHKKEDPWEIPNLLLNINPDYRFSLRHYFFDERETVLYAF